MKRDSGACVQAASYEVAAVSEGENGNLLLGARALTHTSMLTGTVTMLG